MTMRRMRPMQHDPQVGFSAFPTEARFEFSAIEEAENANRGEYITAFSERKRVLASILFVDEASFWKELLIVSGQRRKDALTKFFVLSNIRFVSGGSSEMLRTSRCIRIKLFQSDGPRTLAVIAPPLYSLSSPSVKHFGSRGQLSPFTADKSKLFLKHMWNWGPIHFSTAARSRSPGS